MPIQILPREQGLGETLGTSIGTGIGNGLQQLANMKMQQFAQRNQMALQQEANMQAMTQKHDLLEKTLGPGWGKLAYMPEKMGLMAIQGGWNPGMQQQGGQQPGGMQQNMEVLNNQQPGAQGGVSALQGPSATNDLGKAIGQGAYNTPAMIQARQLQENQQKFTEEQNKLNREAKAKTQTNEAVLKERNQELAEAEKLKPFIKEEQTRSAQIRDVGKDARRAMQILERHKNDWPNWVSGLAQSVAGGKLTRDPEKREFYKITSALPVKIASAFKGQATNMKVKLVGEGKADLSSPWETNKELLQALIDTENDDKKRTLFRIKQKKNNKNPVDLDQRMADYDAAINSPEEYPEFFEKYPQFRPKSMGAEPQKSAAAPAIKVGAKLDKLPPASDYPGMEGLWNGKKVKSDGVSWKGA